MPSNHVQTHTYHNENIHTAATKEGAHPHDIIGNSNNRGCGLPFIISSHAAGSPGSVHPVVLGRAFFRHGLVSEVSGVKVKTPKALLSRVTVTNCKLASFTQEHLKLAGAPNWKMTSSSSSKLYFNGKVEGLSGSTRKNK